MTSSLKNLSSCSSYKKLKIGIIRSAPTRQLVEAVKLLRKKNNHSSISVIMQEQYVSESAEYLCDHVICSHKGGSFGLFSIGLRKIAELRREKFDILVLLYNNPVGIHCLNIDFLALLLGGEKWVVDNNGKFYPLNSFCWIKNMVFRRMPRGLGILILIIFFFPLFCIAFGISILTGSKKKSFKELINYGG